MIYLGFYLVLFMIYKDSNSKVSNQEDKKPKQKRLFALNSVGGYPIKRIESSRLTNHMRRIQPINQLHASNPAD